MTCSLPPFTYIPTTICHQHTTIYGQDECKLEIFDEDWSTWTVLQDADNITANHPRVRVASAFIILDNLAGDLSASTSQAR